MYQVKRAYSTNPNLVTRLQGETIGLNDEVRVNVLPTKQMPGFERVIRKATQSDLKALFESGNPLIEKVDSLVETPVEKVEPLEKIEQLKTEQLKTEKRKKEKQDGELH